MSEPTGCCCASTSYCDHCDLLVGLEGLHVVDVAKTSREVLVVTVESAPAVSRTPDSR